MSEKTLEAVMKAALTTLGEATANNIWEPKPWQANFKRAFKAHCTDEVSRYLAELGCWGYLRTGAKCPGVKKRGKTAPADAILCMPCEAALKVVALDAEEARLTLTLGPDDLPTPLDGPKDATFRDEGQGSL